MIARTPVIRVVCPLSRQQDAEVGNGKPKKSWMQARANSLIAETWISPAPRSFWCKPGRMLASLGEALMTDWNTSLPQEIPPGWGSSAKPAWLPPKSIRQPASQNGSAGVQHGELQNVKPVPHHFGSGRKTSPVIWKANSSLLAIWLKLLKIGE